MPPWPHEPTDCAGDAERTDDAPPAALTAEELLGLQLLACGYAPAQVAALRGVALVDVLWELERPLALLCAATGRGAIAAARARGLIL